MDMALCVLDAGHGKGGIRRGPSMSNADFCRAMNFRRGDSWGAAGKLKTGGVWL